MTETETEEIEEKDEEVEQKLTREEAYEIERDMEKEKKEIAIKNANQIKLNANNSLKVLDVQLTKVLMEITELDKELQNETNQYWIKELPIRNTILGYMKNVGMLINIYTQKENIFATSFEELTEAIDYPDYQKIEESYHAQMEDMREKMKFMRQEVEKVKEGLQEEFDDAVKRQAKKERVKLHREYETVMTEAELTIEEQEEQIKKLQNRLIELNKLLLDEKPGEIIKKGALQIVDDIKGVEKKSSENFTDTIRGIARPSSKFNIIKPEKSGEISDKNSENANGSSKEKDGPETLETEVTTDIINLITEGKDYDQIRKKLSKKYSASTFYKYLNLGIDNERFIKKEIDDDTSYILLGPGKKGDKKDD